MDAVAREGVEEDRQGGRQRLSFAGKHLGNFSLMQDGSTKQLDVEVNHVPLGVVATCYPMVVIDGLLAVDVHEIVPCGQLAVEIVCRHLDRLVLCEEFCRALYDGKYLGAHFVECLLETLQHILLQLVYLRKNRCTVLYVGGGNPTAQFANLCAQLAHRILYLLLNLLCSRAKFVVAECLNLGVHLQHGFHLRTIGLQIARLFVAKEFD